MACQTLKQHSSLTLPTSALGTRGLLLLFTVFMFLIHFYFSAMIKTGVVVQHEPSTITSYADLLRNPSIMPLWFRPSTSHSEFERASPDSEEGRIWERASRIGIDKCRVSLKDEGSYNLLSSVMLQKTVLIGTEQESKLFVTNCCAISRSQRIAPWSNMLQTTMTPDREKPMGLMHTASLKSGTRRLLHFMEQTTVEHNLMDILYDKISFVYSENSESASLKECSSNHISYLESDLTAVDWYHYYNLLEMTCILTGVAFVILLIEVLMGCVTKRRSNSFDSLPNRMFLSLSVFHDSHRFDPYRANSRMPYLSRSLR